MLETLVTDPLPLSGIHNWNGERERKTQEDKGEHVLYFTNECFLTFLLQSYWTNYQSLLAGATIVSEPNSRKDVSEKMNGNGR